MAALPFFCIGGAVQVLLITSRRRGRSIIPKGWPMKGLSHADAAAREAMEEAGVVGVVGQEALGSYGYRKRMSGGYKVRCQVFVYPLLVLGHRLAWREQRQRSLSWQPLDEAADHVSDDELASLLRTLGQQDARALKAFAAANANATAAILMPEPGAGR